MSYYISDNQYIDIQFNQIDIVIQLEYNNKIYQDTILIDEIKSQNPFFKNIQITEKFIVNCLNKNKRYLYKFSIDNKFNIKFTYINDLQNLDLEFNIPPIRQDISNNIQFIKLKKLVNQYNKELESFRWINNFYYNDNLQDIININNDEPIMFSNYNENYLDAFLDIYYNHEHSYYDILSHKFNNNGIYSSGLYGQRINDINQIENKTLTLYHDPREYTYSYGGPMKYTRINKIRNYKYYDKNVNFMTEKFKQLKTLKLVLVDFDYDIIELNNLPLNLEGLIFVNSKFDNDKLNLIVNLVKLKEISFYNCNIEDLRLLINMNSLNKIRVIECQIKLNDELLLKEHNIELIKELIKY